MSTRDVPKRFTAQQALGFLEDVVIPRTPTAQLDVEVEDRPPVSQNWWVGLDATFIKEWAAYRHLLSWSQAARSCAKDR
ncbi:hypothetical protein H0H93_010885 [Arthromyces matolae]|nr:hypothetical protein H0H93_010885 [Arthromyces matolae]